MIKPREKILDLYWRTAAERQEIFFRKIKGEEELTKDPVFREYKFCNVYRAADRVSQFLIKSVIYDKEREPEETLFRIMFFRLFNKIETWEKMNGVELDQFSFEKYNKKLTEIKKRESIYGNAFILCANKFFGFEEKHKNHLVLLEKVFIKEKVDFTKAKSLRELFLMLKNLPLIGNFMAYQIAIDFNYSPVFNFSENDFTIPGPGAIRGINKCFEDVDKKDYEKIIFWMVENQDQEFKRLGINFKSLWGRKMTAIDCQNWFCETDKYCRAAVPELKSNRTKIKNKYKQSTKRIEYFFPPKWQINTRSKIK